MFESCCPDHLKGGSARIRLFSFPQLTRPDARGHASASMRSTAFRTTQSGASIDSVTSDGFRAMIDMASHLHKQRHHQMLMFRQELDHYTEISRRMGFEAETRRLGLETEVLKVATNDQAAEQSIEHIKGDNPVTAACTVNDDMAADITTKLLEEGIKVPDQVSITGFDVSEFSKNTHPPLATIKMVRRQLGAEGAQTILRRISDSDAPFRKLVIRDSVMQS